MKVKQIRRACLSLLALCALFPAAPTVGAQELQRDRPSRRVTNPVRGQSAQPAPRAQEPRLVSTADEGAQDETPRRTTRRPPPRQTEQDQLRGTVDRLSEQVDRLSEELSQMRSDQRSLFELERLSRAEQRAENLRAQLREVTDKEFQFQDRLAQIQDELQPDAIQRRAAVVGTLNPGAVREQIQASLERERTRVQRQLELVANSRSRLEAAVATAEQEVERLRLRVEAADQLREEPAAQNTGPVQPTTPPDEQTPAQPPGA